MCGLTGFVSKDKDCRQYLHDSLKLLTARGYDSWGYYIHNGQFEIWNKYIGEYNSSFLNRLSKPNDNYIFNLGFAHTRWATNGVISAENAHPHFSKCGRFAIVHNGILEKNVPPEYESDTKYLVDYLGENGIDNKSISKLKQQVGKIGAFLLIDVQHRQLYVYSDNSPLYLAEFDDHKEIASEIGCFSLNPNKTIKIHDNGVLYAIHADISFVFGTFINNAEKRAISHNVTMLDEINQQIDLLDNKYTWKIKESFKKILFVGCGSSFYAGKFISDNLPIESYALYPYDLKNQHIQDGQTIVIFISQSGETKDIINAVKWAQICTNRVYIVTNNINSTAANMVSKDYVIDIQAGYENSVAATKTFWCTILTFLGTCLPIYELKQKLNHIFLNIYEIDICNQIKEYDHILILGSDNYYTIAQEIALKFKEVCYKHAEAVNASEIKHGPIALIDDKVLTLSLGDNQQAVNEVRARNGKIVELQMENDEIYCVLQLLYTLQLIIYYYARENNLNPERPRSLAKTVSV